MKTHFLNSKAQPPSLETMDSANSIQSARLNQGRELERKIMRFCLYFFINNQLAIKYITRLDSISPFRLGYLEIRKATNDTYIMLRNKYNSQACPITN